MQFQLFLIFIVLVPGSIFSAVRLESRRNFHGFQVLRVNVSNPEQFNDFAKLEVDNNGLDFWTHPSTERGTDIMVPKEHLKTVKEYFAFSGIQFNVMIEDLQKIVSEENDEIALSTARTVKDNINWDAYQAFDSISLWLDKLAEENPTLCSTEVIGQTTEGRPMKLVKISISNGESSLPKRIIWIDGGIHAREWISAATATYFINELVTKSGEYTDILSKVDFYILPVMNPDGYVHTWTQDRLWRKTRSDQSSFFLTPTTCRGVDPNRNFGYKFGGSGTSADPCSETYKGPHAFSEPETKSVRDFILKTPNIEAYITLHSYSQVWVYPWGYASELPPDWMELDSLARQAVSALKQRYGTTYTVGSSTNVLYAAAGGSDDWAKSVNIKYAYTIELRDTGRHGFLLPASLIKPTALETWDGVQVVARHVAEI